MATDQHDRDLRVDGHHAIEQLQPSMPGILTSDTITTGAPGAT